MSDRRISVHDRVQALGRLNAIAFELNKIAAWLGEVGVETESDMLDKAARGILAACWLLERPIRLQLPPERWQQPASYPQPADGWSPR